jgi:hypothetical protein
LRFIDASTFLYAFLKPERAPPPDVAALKVGAQGILRRVNEGESVVTSVVHVSEVANILEARLRLSECRRIISDILNKRSVEVVDVSKNLYVASLRTADIHDVGINDALAFNVMRESGIDEIYSFDKHFDDIPGVKRLTR